MPKSPIAALLAALASTLALAACAYHPSLEDQILIVDSPADVRTCRRLGTVSRVVPTGPEFEPVLEAMVAQTAALRGTDLFLSRSSRDWAAVQGIAYRCPHRRLIPVDEPQTGEPRRVEPRTVVRAKG